MSTDYTVLVRRERWPDRAALQVALDVAGFPVKVDAGPLSDGDLSVSVDGYPLRLLGYFGPVVSYGKLDTNETLAEIGAEYVAHDGDAEFSVGLGSDLREWRAALLIMAVLVRTFDGYGFEMQGETHGRDAWADDLVAAAEDFRRQLAAQ